MLVLLAAGAAVVANAGTYFVDSAATGAGDGTGWSSPYTLAQALEAATNEGDEIRLKAGDYAVTAETAIANNIVLRGGYTGEGETREGKSNIVRSQSDANYFRLFSVTATAITFDGIGFRNGALPTTTGVLGQAVKFAGTCAAVFVDCDFTGNGHVTRPNNDGWTAVYGGAIYIGGGSLAVTNCVFDGNGIKISGQGNQCGHGGAIYAGSSVVSLSNSRFVNNCNQAAHNRLVYGGALAIESCSAVTIDACQFATNNTYRGNYDATISDTTYGGAMYAKSCPNVVIRDCVVRDGYLTQSSLAAADLKCIGCGVFFYFDTCTVSMSRTVLYNRGYNAKSYSGLIDNKGGPLALTNVLFVAGTYNWCLTSYGAASKIDAVNCTFTGTLAAGDASHSMAAYSQHTGEASFKNCVFWDNYAGAYNIVGGTQPTLQNCTTTDDPEWYDTTYCHPVSEAGRYDGGWFTGGTWVTTDTTVSSLIDAGMASMSEGDEPQPNGRRINLGYDGGSPTASKSVMGSQPIVDPTALMIYSYPAKDATADGATVCADVASTGGGANPTVTVVWDSSDKGRTSVSAWAHSAELPGTYAPWQLASYQITGATGSEVYYRFVAHNGEKGDAWSDGVRSFQLAQMPTLADAQVRRTFRTSAQPAATLADDGGSATTVYLVWWATDDPTAKTTNFYNYGAAVASGTTVTWDLSGLSPNTSYTCQIFATSSAGEVSLPTQTFTTLASDVAQVFCVGSEETGLGDGSSWANAADLRLTLAAATASGDEIRLKAGDYLVTSQISVQNLAGLTIRGGYTGADLTTRDGRSNIYRDTSLGLCRLFYAKASTIVFDGIGFWNGKSSETGIIGMGVYLASNCHATFIDCEFKNNGTNHGINSQNNAYGGALYATGGSLAITNSVFDGNYLYAGNNCNLLGWGGAIYATGAAVSISGTRFTKNYVLTAHNRNCGGGAVALIGCTSPVIDGCLFQTNYIYRGTYNAEFSNMGAGGAGYFKDCTGLVIRDSQGFGNYSQNAYFSSSGNYRCLGTGLFFYLYNTSGSMVRTVLYNRGDPNHNSYSGLVDVLVDDAKSADFAFTNVLFVAGTRGWCLTNKGANSRLTAVNCTFTGVKSGDSSHVMTAYSQYTGAATFENCIFWDNYAGAYTIFSGSDPVLRNTMTTTDPKWADTVYCHPMSTAGSYTNGWFTGGEWVTDAETSPAVDYVSTFATDLAEPQPNGRHANAGYDGNTSVASKSDLGALTEGVLAVYAYADTLPSGDSVTLYGDVRQLSTGAEKAAVTLVWDTADRGTSSLGAWTHQIPCGDYQPWQCVNALVSGVTGTIVYRFYADDGVNTAWSADARSYTKVEKPTIRYNTDAQPFSHVYRTSAKVNVELVSNGGVDTTVWATIAPTSDPSATTEVKLNGGDPVAAGTYAIAFTGLTPNTAYSVTVTANNTVGSVILAAKSFTTLAMDATVTLRVAPTASGRGDGTSWDDPTEIATAFAAATGDGDAILLQVGTYPTYGHDLYERTNLVIRGGYAADGTPYSGESKLTLDGVNTADTDCRHLVIRKSTVTLDSVTFHKGRNSTTTDTWGQSVGVKENASVFVTNCVFASNGVSYIPNGGTTYIGGAIGANSGVLTVVNSVFDGNNLHYTADNPVPYGGAIGVNGAATVSVKNCTFNRNRVGMVHARAGGGGALAFMGGAQATVENCLFTTNYARTSGGSGVYEPQTNYGPWGGTIYTTGAATTLKMQDLKIIGGYAFNGEEVAKGRDLGGTFCFNGGAVSGDRIEIVDAGANEYADSTAAGKYATGSIAIYAGTVALTNVAHLGAKRGAIVSQQGGTVEFVNGTFAGAEGRQKATAGFPACGYLQRTNGSSGAATFKNCIFWDNTGGFRSMTNDAITVTASYSDLEGEPDAANHVLSVDPKFVGAEKAAKQVKDEGEGEGAATFLSLQAKTYSLRSASPCSNAGADVGFTADSVDLLGNPRIRGSRVDMGAFESVQRGLLLIVK